MKSFPVNALIVGLLMFCGNMAFGQSKTIAVETQHTALVMEVNSKKDLNIIYFGKKLSDPNEYSFVPGAYRQSEDYTGIANSVYTPSGSRNLFEPAITLTHADGNNSLDLKFLDSKVEKLDSNVSLISVSLKDPVYDFFVTLYYKVYYKEDVVEQWSKIMHKEKGNVVVYKYASANVYLQSKAFWLKQYHGDWAKEMQPEISKLTHGIKTLDSKLGTRADLFQPRFL